MPAFHTHWLVAIEALDSEPKYLINGFRAYKEEVQVFSKAVYDRLRRISDFDDDDAAGKFGAFVHDERLAFDKRLRSAKQDDITCFAAYALGACGPDFWMCPSVSRGGLIPDFGDKHFDLGHYNRTHRQFELAIERLKRANKDSLQSKVEMSYFFGMATHIAADLIIHQLVNVSAGAYNLLEKRWKNEHGAFFMKIFNAHNKVEHFWDSYIRSRYLGDFGPLFGDQDRADWVTPHAFPTLDRVKTHVAGMGKSAKAAKALAKQLDRDDTRLDLELPLILPRLFADRMLAGEVAPFIYDVVVFKLNGAYPEKDIRSTMKKEATDEAIHYQMWDDKSGLSERRKIAYFGTELNTDGFKSWKLARSTSNFNYLTYTACPNLERVQKFGPDTFYHLQALGPFVHSGVRLARKFVALLRNGFDHNSTSLGELGCFWNLDTGLGLKVEHVPSDTGNEVTTRLDFLHVFDLGGMEPVKYQRRVTYLGVKSPKQYTSGWSSQPPFKTYKAKAPFPALAEVWESDPTAYLKRIPLEHGAEPPPSDRTLGSFFQPVSADVKNGAHAPTNSVSVANEARVLNLQHRLNLSIRVAIADLEATQPTAAQEKLGFFLWGDQALGLGKACTEEPHQWLAKKHGECLDYAESPSLVRNRLQFFSTQLLLNLAGDEKLKREIAKGKWNNVVPYDQHKKVYGRNFAVGTGRKYVLNGIKSGNFDPTSDFVYYSNVSPTEQVFFTLYLLVNTPNGCFDMISRERVAEAKLDELKRMESVGVVKIVLFYILGPGGAVQLNECYVDSLPVQVAVAADHEL